MCIESIYGFSKWINAFGLLLDIVGAYILIQWVLEGPQQRYKKNPDGSRTWPGDSKKQEYIKGQERYKPLALGLIVGGFILQMVSVLCK